MDPAWVRKTHSPLHYAVRSLGIAAVSAKSPNRLFPPSLDCNVLCSMQMRGVVCFDGHVPPASTPQGSMRRESS